MFGLLLVRPAAERGRAVAWDTRRICGVRFFTVTVAAGRRNFLTARRMRRAARQMARAGVRAAAFPPDFAWGELFEKCGVRAATDEALRCALAVKSARRAMETRGLTPGECCAALLGERMSAALGRALMELAVHVRYTLLNAGGGGGEICSVLRREYGVSVLRGAGEAQLQRADVIVTFDGARPCGRPGALWIPAGAVTAAEGFENAAANMTCLLPPRAEEQLPEGCGRAAVLSLLLQAGALRTEELEVAEIVQNA